MTQRRWKHVYNNLWRCERNTSGSRFLSVKEFCAIFIAKRKFQVVVCCLVRFRNKLKNWVFGFQKQAVKTNLKRDFPSRLFMCRLETVYTLWERFGWHLKLLSHTQGCLKAVCLPRGAWGLPSITVSTSDVFTLTKEARVTVDFTVCLVTYNLKDFIPATWSFSPDFH